MSDSRTAVMSRCVSAVLSAALGLSSAMIAVAANDVWDANGAIPPNGIWSTGANWGDNTTPGNSDTATFNVEQTYAVTFNAAPTAIQALTVSAGIPTFVSSGGDNTLNVTSASGGQDVSINGGSTLSLGASGNPLHLNVGDDLTVNGGGTLNVNFGSQVNTTDLFLAQGSNGELNISGDGSALTQVSGAGITVGAASGSTGTIRLAATANGGTLTTGTGPLTINATGTVNIGFGGNFGGELHANGDVIVNGGTLTKEFSGALILASGKTIAVQNGGTYAAATIEVGYSGNGSLVVDGSSSSVSAGFPTPSHWGWAGHTANVTFSNNATGSFVAGGIELAGSPTAGTQAIVSVVSGADLTSGNMKLAHNAGGFASLVIDGAGSSVTLAPSASLTIGGASGAAFLSIQNGGTLTVGDSGSTILNSSGLINIQGGNVDLKTLVLNGGGINSFTAGSLSYFGDLFVGTGGLLGTNRNLTSNHHLTLSGTTIIGSSGTLSLNGGTLSTATLLPHPGSTFIFNSGTLGITGSYGLEIDVSGGPIPGNLTLYPQKTLDVTYKTTIHDATTVTIDGGTFNTGELSIQPLGGLNFISGTLGITGVDGLGIGAASDDPFQMGLTLNSLQTLNVTYDTYVQEPLTIDGGTFSTGSLTTIGDFAFDSGTLAITGPNGQTIGDPLPNTPFPGNLTLNSQRKLIVTNTTTIAPGRTLTLDGGTLNTGALEVQGAFEFKRGTLGITGAGGLTIGTSGPFGSTFTLGSSRNLNVSNTTTVDSGSLLVIESGAAFSTGTLINNGELALNGLAAVAGGTTYNNNGLIRGEGRITAAVSNNATGEIRGENGKRIKFQGANGANVGIISLQGGTVEFLQPLTNAPTGRIIGRGTLIVGDAGIENHGHVAFSSGITDVYSHLFNQTGVPARGVSISGNSDVTFWNDVYNGEDSLFRVAAGSSTTFFGVLAGEGISGPGDVYIEANLNPGFSPAIAEFGGNVHFGSSALLVIELGGKTPGTQHDQLNVAGLLALDGALAVSLINGFTPTIGQSFNILDWSSRSGVFSSLTLPTLAGLVWDTSQLYVSGTIIAGSALPGDYNQNGVVDAADYVVWRKNNNTAVTLPNDATPGTSSADYDVWRTHFGQQPPGNGAGAIANAAVPEPTALLQLFLVAMGYSIQRHRAVLRVPLTRT